MDVGTLVGDRFEIERRAASGGMGAVYLAFDRATGVPAAIKIVRVSGRDVAERLIREGRALAQLDHPNVVRYLGHGTTPDGDPFLAMEWIEGETLSRRLQRQPMAVGEAVRLVLRVADALGHAHAKGIVHRDVKPGNLILRDNDPSKVVLVDFGVARGRRDDGLTVTGMIIGTPSFMSPEQARGARNIEPAADVFALGCLLYRCLTGRNAFEADDQVAVLAKILLDDPPPLGALVNGIDAELDALARRFLSKDPAGRPQTGAAAAEAIRALAERTHVGSSRAPAPPERLTLTERRLVSLVLAPTPLDPEATMAGDEAPGGIEPIRAITARWGALCEVLANGTLVVAMVGRGSATDQAAQAARCALELRAALHGPPLVLVTGRAVVEATESSSATGITRSGGADVFEAAAVLSARLQAIGEHECIVVDETTAGLLDRNFLISPHKLGLQLRGVRTDGADAGRLLGKVTACVGRERELSTLEALLTECETEPVARAVLVTGAPGMGKSRLLREFIARVGSRAQIFHAVGDAIVSGSPFAMLAQAVRGSANIEAEDTPETRGRKLRARIARHVQRREVDRVSEFLGEAAGITAEAPSGRVLAARADPRLMTEQIRSAWVEWIGAECAAKPVLLVLDDVQWGDILSMRLVSDAISALPDSPLCALAVGRPEGRDALPDVLAERAVPVPLGALSRKASEKLVRDALDDVGDDVVTKIVARAGGQPLLLEELVRAHAEGHEDGTATAAVAMVQSRLETLDAESRRVLRAASVFGEAFWRGGVEHLLSTSIAAQLDILESKELIVRRPTARYAGEQELAFRHALVKDAAYAMLTNEDAALGHRLASEWLEKMGDSNPVVLAEHWARSDRPKRAIPHLIRAAEIALEAADFAGVRDRAARARAIGAVGQQAGVMRYLEAEALRWAGDTKGGEEFAISALDDLELGSDPWLHSVRVAAFCAGILGHLDTLRSLVERLLEIQPTEATSRAWGLAANQAASNLLTASPTPRAYELLRRTENVDKDALDRDPVAAMYHFHARAIAAFRHGHYEELLETTTASVAHAKRAGDVRFGTYHQTNVGFAYGQLGELETALASLTSTREEAQRYALHTAAMTLDQNRGHILMCLGRLEEARDLEESVIAQTKEQAPRLYAIAHACLARIQVRLGDLDAAVRTAQTGVDAAPTDVPRIYALACLGEALLARGDAEGAVDAAHRGLQIALRLGGGHVGDVLAGRVQVEGLMALGRNDDARRVLELPLALVRGRAASIKDPARRKTMLERVEDHRRVLELVRELALPDALGA